VTISVQVLWGREDGRSTMMEIYHGNIYKYFIGFLSVVLGLIFLASCQFYKDDGEELDQVQKKYGYHVTKHALERMHQRKISSKHLYHAIEKGKKYYDIAQQSYIYHDFNSKVNVIIKDKSIVTLYRGPVKSRWKELSDEEIPSGI
jgi:hypothetical protein